jgi:hypothetical protein
MLKDRANGGHAIFYFVNNFLILILLMTMDFYTLNLTSKLYNPFNTIPLKLAKRKPKIQKIRVGDDKVLFL